MPRKTISLYAMPYEIMLLLHDPSGVVYFNQVGGIACMQEELEGVLAPVDVGTANVERLAHLPYTYGAGITPEIADAIDAVLTSVRHAEFLKVDRARLDDSMEAWVYVIAETKSDTPNHLVDDYFGSAFEFGTTTGVLTWPNSD